MKRMGRAPSSFLSPEHDCCCLVLLVSFCALAKSTFHGFSLDPHLQSNWPSQAFFECLCAEKFPESLPDAFYLAGPLALNSK